MSAMPTSLQDDLRTAMQIELTTIPLYLYACWSIVPFAEGGSAEAAEAARTIMAVVDEEMLHMGLVANLINALGGTPALTDPRYLPRYPGTILGPDGIPTQLQPLSPAAVGLFMRIELPEWQPPAAAPGNYTTIAQFYEHLRGELTPAMDYSGGKQLRPWSNPGAGDLIPITDYASACAALDVIIEQGEGLAQDRHDDGDHELAHYWKFKNVLDNIEAGNLQFPGDVYPLVSNPDATRYTPAQQQADAAFNRVYSNLLNALQEVFSGAQQLAAPDVFQPTPHFAAPIAYMNDMRQHAAFLRNQGVVPGTNLLAGPTFAYVPGGNG